MKDSEPVLRTARIFECDIDDVCEATRTMPFHTRVENYLGSLCELRFRVQTSMLRQKDVLASWISTRSDDLYPSFALAEAIMRCYPKASERNVFVDILPGLLTCVHTTHGAKGARTWCDVVIQSVLHNEHIKVRVTMLSVRKDSPPSPENARRPPHREMQNETKYETLPRKPLCPKRRCDPDADTLQSFLGHTSNVCALAIPHTTLGACISSVCDDSTIALLFNIIYSPVQGPGVHYVHTVLENLPGSCVQSVEISKDTSSAIVLISSS